MYISHGMILLDALHRVGVAVAVGVCVYGWAHKAAKWRFGRALQASRDGECAGSWTLDRDYMTCIPSYLAM